MEETIKGDFNLIIDPLQISNNKWFDKVTQTVVFYWGRNTTHVLYNYYGHGTYSHEQSLTTERYIHLKRYGTALLREGIIIIMANTTMDNVKLDNGCVLDRFRKQVLDIVKT